MKRRTRIIDDGYFQHTLTVFGASQNYLNALESQTLKNSRNSLTKETKAIKDATDLTESYNKAKRIGTYKRKADLREVLSEKSLKAIKDNRLRFRVALVAVPLAAGVLGLAVAGAMSTLNQVHVPTTSLGPSIGKRADSQMLAVSDFYNSVNVDPIMHNEYASYFNKLREVTDAQAVDKTLYTAEGEDFHFTQYTSPLSKEEVSQRVNEVPVPENARKLLEDAYGYYGRRDLASAKINENLTQVLTGSSYRSAIADDFSQPGEIFMDLIDNVPAGVVGLTALTAVIQGIPLFNDRRLIKRTFANNMKTFRRKYKNLPTYSKQAMKQLSSTDFINLSTAVQVEFARLIIDGHKEMERQDAWDRTRTLQMEDEEALVIANKLARERDRALGGTLLAGGASDVQDSVTETPNAEKILEEYKKSQESTGRESEVDRLVNGVPTEGTRIEPSKGRAMFTFDH